RLPTSPLFPYTTLFRSEVFRHFLYRQVGCPLQAGEQGRFSRWHMGSGLFHHRMKVFCQSPYPVEEPVAPFHPGIAPFQILFRWRSEEHTSELQSRENLV